MKTKRYEPRTYRTICSHNNFINFTVSVKESDLFIKAYQDLSVLARESLNNLRNEIENYIATDQRFLTSLQSVTVREEAPVIVKEMAMASAVFGVGPMAAVAGAVAERVGRILGQHSKEVVVENGGDIFFITSQKITTAIYAGSSSLSMKLGIESGPHPEGLSICTSSGTVGHSLSLGIADAVTVIASNGGVADAAATAIGNMIKSEKDIQPALKYAAGLKKILGLVIIVKDKIGVIGESLNLVALVPNKRDRD